MKRDWWNKEFRVMSAFGDSITAGGQASIRERRWSNLLTDMINERQRFPVVQVNMGIGGNVLSPVEPGYFCSYPPAALERVERDVLKYAANGQHLPPDLLIIAFSINDARSGASKELFCEEMVKLLDIIRKEIRPLIVLVGPTYMNGFDKWGKEYAYADLKLLHEYNEAMRALAQEQDCLFADVLNAFGEADWLVHDDGVHPNDSGHRVIANKILEVLLANCSGLSLETKIVEAQMTPWRDEAVLDNRVEGWPYTI